MTMSLESTAMVLQVFTALSYLLFSQENVDIAIVEVSYLTFLVDSDATMFYNSYGLFSYIYIYCFKMLKVE